MATTDKPSNQEEDYFAREEVEKKRKLALRQQQDTEAQQREALRKLHYLKCPKCGLDLHTLNQGKVEIDTCFNCKGIWLDAGELEQLIKAHGEGGTVMKAVLNLFKR